MSTSGTTIPAEARAGLMRAWLEILRERHPQLTWLPVEHGAERRQQEVPIQPVSVDAAVDAIAREQHAG